MAWEGEEVEVLASRVLLRPTDYERSVHFYGSVLGLAVFREWRGGTVFFLGGGYLELTGPRAGAPSGPGVALWLQVHDVDEEVARLVRLGVRVDEAPDTKPWGLREAWVADPDGTRLCLVEVPPDHPIRRRVD